MDSHKFVQLCDLVICRLTSRCGGEPSRLFVEDWKKHLVPILFPQDTHKAMRLLEDELNKQNANDQESNRFMVWIRKRATAFSSCGRYLEATCTICE